MSRSPYKIPNEFFSFETEEPFRTCIECDRDLREKGLNYVVEKAIRNYPEYGTQDIIFDYAICIECAFKIRQSFSHESIQRIDKFLGENMQNLVQDKQNMDSLFLNGPDQCFITKKKRSDLLEYQIYAHCKGDFLDPMVPPYLISDKAVEMILPLISKSTQDILDGFFDKHFSPDPSLMNPVPKLVLV